MSSIDINKLIQESIANRSVVDDPKDLEAGLENALQGVDEGEISNEVLDKGIVAKAGEKIAGAAAAVGKKIGSAATDRPKLAAGLAAGAGALGAGYAAKKYLQRRKAKK